MSDNTTLEEGRTWLLDRLEKRAHPVDVIDPGSARQAIEGLAGLDPEPWAAAWGAVADKFVAKAESAHDPAQEQAAWWQAYQVGFIGRYPVPNHPAKQRMYQRALDYFARATAFEDPPLEIVELPFAGRRDGDGENLRFYLTKPKAATEPLPVVMVWAGIDTWKEEMHRRLGAMLRSKRLAVLLIDMPGVGESPVLASADAERQWTPIFDWIDSRDDLDSSRVCALGASFGGYWAMKLAYTHSERLRCAVNWGGGVHITFTPEWQHKSRNASSYLMDLMAARARIFGGETFEDYVARSQELSLLDQGWLDKPCAPLLLVNGRDDLQNSIDDIYLSLDHGGPKAARVFDGGHMGTEHLGIGPAPVITEWLLEQLLAGRLDRPQ